MKITIIGVGLIGGSLALSIKEKKIASYIYGVDKNEENIKKAVELGLINEGTDLDTAIQKSTLIILAVPVDAIQALLPTIMDQINPQQVVMDMGSTKEQLLEAINTHI